MSGLISILFIKMMLVFVILSLKIRKRSLIGLLGIRFVKIKASASPNSELGNLVIVLI
jgi:hypothetical protein